MQMTTSPLMQLLTSYQLVVACLQVVARYRTVTLPHDDSANVHSTCNIASCSPCWQHLIIHLLLSCLVSYRTRTVHLLGMTVAVIYAAQAGCIHVMACMTFPSSPCNPKLLTADNLPLRQAAIQVCTQLELASAFRQQVLHARTHAHVMSPKQQLGLSFAQTMH